MEIRNRDEKIKQLNKIITKSDKLLSGETVRRNNIVFAAGATAIVGAGVVVSLVKGEPMVGIASICFAPVFMVAGMIVPYKDCFDILFDRYEAMEELHAYALEDNATYQKKEKQLTK